MQKTSVESWVAGGVLGLSLSSDDGMNVLSVETRKEIWEKLKAHTSDGSVRCVTISSEGKAFSAGADLNHLLTLGKKEAISYSKFVRSFLDYVENYPKPTIGLVDGVAVGGGLELLMTLDLVMATPNARFGQTELNVGLIPGGGGTQRLPRLVGARKAKEMIFTGRLISADEALSIGLVNMVVPAGDLKVEAAKLAERILSKSPRTLILAKKAINEVLSSTQAEGLALEGELYSRVLNEKATKEEIRRFLGRSGALRGHRESK